MGDTARFALPGIGINRSVTLSPQLPKPRELSSVCIVFFLPPSLTVNFPFLHSFFFFFPLHLSFQFLFRPPFLTPSPFYILLHFFFSFLFHPFVLYFISLLHAFSYCLSPSPSKKQTHDLRVEVLEDRATSAISTVSPRLRSWAWFDVITTDTVQ